MKYTPLAAHFRVTNEKFWYFSHLEYLVETLRFSEWAAATVAALGVRERKQRNYARL